MSQQAKAQRTPAEAGTVSFSLRELLFYFLRLGTFGFGGPIALAGYMQRDLVERRRWYRARIIWRALRFRSFRLAVDPETHRVYTPEQEERGTPAARMIVYEAVPSR